MASQLQSDRLWEKCRKMILIPRNNTTKGYAIGYWPIPEDWLNLNSPNLVIYLQLFEKNMYIYIVKTHLAKT